jgi:uncharacterized protein (TIGR02284 family)
MKTSSEIVSVLNNLIETNVDRVKGYEKAASDAEDTEIKELCLSFAAQSKAFKTQLEQLVKEYNGQPRENGLTKGAAYRAAMEVKHSIFDSKKSILSLCETAEDVALENYKHAKIDSIGFPARVVTIILNQNADIIKALEKIRFFQNVLIEH